MTKEARPARNKPGIMFEKHSSLLFPLKIEEFEPETLRKFIPENLSCLKATNSLGHTPLLFAAREECLPYVSLLLELGACVNHANKSHGWSALLFASCNGDVEMVRLLLEYGADIDHSNHVRAACRLILAA